MAEKTQEDPFAEYLDQVEIALRMPPSATAEVRAELTAHLIDSSEALIADGMAPPTAEREALARLGRPDVLGDELRRVHQSKRRLLAAAGGGAFTAGGYAILGVMLGFAALFLSFAVVSLASTTLFGPGAGPITLFFDRGWNSFLAAIAAWVAAWLATRHGIVAFADRSRWRVADVRIAAVAIAVTAALAIALTWDVEQNWASVAAIAALPGVAGVAALTVRDRPLYERRPRITAVKAAAVLVPLILVLSMAALYLPGSATGELDTGGRPVPHEEMWQESGWAAVGREFAWDAPPDPAIGLTEANSVLSASVPADHAKWSNWRLEVWAGDAQWDSPALSHPLAVIELAPTDERLTAAQRVDVFPGVVRVWGALTADDGSGERYVLRRQGVQTAFKGTIVDWMATLVTDMRQSRR